jgi:hypothetical protein
VIEPELGVEIRRKRHGLAGLPFRRSVLLGGGCSPAPAMHHQKQAGEVLRVDLDWRAVGQVHQRLKGRVSNLENRIDAARSTDDVNRVRAIDSRDGIDRLVEIAGAQRARVRVASRHDADHTRMCADKERFFCVKRTILRKTAIALVRLSITSNSPLTDAHVALLDGFQE